MEIYRRALTSKNNIAYPLFTRIQQRSTDNMLNINLTIIKIIDFTDVTDIQHIDNLPVGVGAT
jgi:hypothetical protein